MDYQRYLKVALDIITRLKPKFQEYNSLDKRHFTTKNSAKDLVTVFDVSLENIILKKLRATFPEHKFIGEESEALSGPLTDAPTWMVDPIDGTTNFVHSFPFFCVSIGMCHRKEPVLGVIYCPPLDKLYHAAKGCGAFCNNTPIHVSDITEFGCALLISNFVSVPDELTQRKRVNDLKNVLVGSDGAHGMRTLGSAALSCATIASGGAECFFEEGIHCWDVAAGIILVREAGGVALTLGKSELDMTSDNYICANSLDIIDCTLKRLKIE